MGDNLPNIELPIAEWVDLYDLSGIPMGVSLMVENTGSPDVYLAVQAAQPAIDHDSYNVVQRGNGVRLQNAPGATGAWAFCNSPGGKVSVGICQQDGFFQASGNIGAESISPPNSSIDPLAPGGTYTGDWINTTGIGIVYVSVFSDQDSAIDGCIIEQSVDGINADFDDVFTIKANRGKNFAINPHARFMRVRYVNGAIAQTAFRLQTKLNKTGLASTHRIQDSITTDDDARLVKAVLTGEDPRGDFVNFRATRLGNFRVSIDEYGDTSSIDPFARLRTSTPYTLFDSKQLHDKQPLFWDEIVAGAAASAHDPANANTVMTVTASAADYVIRQTKLRPNYQPGKGQLIAFTFHAPQQAGVKIQMGAFDGTGATFRTPQNGIFLEITENQISWNIAKNGVTTETATQASWNFDPFDGTGPSGLTLDPNGVLIAFVDIEWLGVGRVRTGFFIAGIPRYCHFFRHSNNPAFTSVYMSTPNLPLRYYIESDGTGGGTLDHICSTVISEGGIQQTGILRSVNTGVTHLDANLADTKYAIIGIRLQAAYYDITVLPEYFSMISETNDDFKWTVELNPVINGAFTYNALASSSIEYALGATANTVATPGIVIDSGFSKSSTSIDRRIITALTLGSTIAGVQDTFVLTVTPLASNADIQASLTFRELL